MIILNLHPRGACFAIMLTFAATALIFVANGSQVRNMSVLEDAAANINNRKMSSRKDYLEKCLLMLNSLTNG